MLIFKMYLSDKMLQKSKKLENEKNKASPNLDLKHSYNSFSDPKLYDTSQFAKKVQNHCILLLIHDIPY